MATPSESPALTPQTVQPPIRRPKGRRIVTILCAGVLLWYGVALYYWLTHAWHEIHFIPGFVSYGAHDTEFSTDRTRIAIAHRENAKVVDWVHGKELSRLQQYGRRGISDFSSDGRIVSYFSEEGMGEREAYVWNAADGRVLGQLKLPDQDATEHCLPFFSPNDTKIVAESADGFFTWDSANFKDTGRIKISRNPVPRWRTFMSWHPVTHEMTGVDADGKLLRIDLKKHTAEPLLAGQTKGVKDAEWSPDGKRLVTVDRDDGAVAIWDIASGAVVASLAEKEMDFAAFSPDGGRLVTRSPRFHVEENGRRVATFWEHRTRIWDAESGRLLQDRYD